MRYAQKFLVHGTKAKWWNDEMAHSIVTHKKKSNDSLLRISQPRINDCPCTRTSLALSLSLSLNLFLRIVQNHPMKLFIRKKITIKISSANNVIGFFYWNHTFSTQSKKIEGIFWKNSPIKSKLEICPKNCFSLISSMPLSYSAHLFNISFDVNFYSILIQSNWIVYFYNKSLNSFFYDFFKTIFIVGIYLRLLLNKITFIGIRHPVESRVNVYAF